MKQAIDALEGHTKPLVRKLVYVLSQDSIELVGFTFYGVTYDEPSRTLHNETLIANVKFRTYTPGAIKIS